MKSIRFSGLFLPAMQNSPRKQAISDLLILTGLCITGMALFSAVGLLVFSLFSGSEALTPDVFSNPDPSKKGLRTGILLLQGIISIGSFVLFPALIRFLRPGSAKHRSLKPSLTLLILISGLGLLMLPVNAWLASWNQSIHLPDFLEGIQSWAWQKEKEMEQLTSYLVDFSGTGEMLLGFLVISLIAGLSEEFFFRKMIQPRLIAFTGNPHAGIWITAFIFSAIHIQFYGLLPRMALGALFGYYFYWTGNIWLPVLAHALNNGFTLAGLILYRQQLSPVNVEDPSEVHWALGALAAGLVWSLSSMVKEEAHKISRISAKIPDSPQS